MRSDVILYSSILAILFYACTRNEAVEIPARETVPCAERVTANSAPNISNEICNSPTCIKYIEIWRDLFKKENNISDAFFDKHISLYGAREVAPAYFRVFYSFNIGYVTESASDIFYIKSASGNFLSKEEIMSMKQFGISTIANNDKLFFATYESAYNAGIKKANVKTLCFGGYNFDGGNTGTVILNLWGKLASYEDSCVVSRVNLHTGEISVYETNCSPRPAIDLQGF